jgi:hypothetical protein
MTAQQFTYRPVTITIESQVIELEVCGEIDSSGKSFWIYFSTKPTRCIQTTLKSC